MSWLESKASRAALGTATLAAGHGGIARVARMCARALVENGVDAELISFLDVTNFEMSGRRVSGCQGSKLAFAARMHRAALTRTHMLYDSVGLGRAHPIIPGLVRPFATWMHGLEVYENMRTEYRDVLARASLVISNSNYTLDRHQTIHGPLSQARVCRLATEQDSAPESLAQFTGPPSVLIVGRIEATEGWKGHAELLDCWPDVVSAVPGARLAIAGGGTGMEALLQMVSASSVAGQIDVLGFVPESEMSTLFARTHVYAMPSRQEGFGIAYIEAMRHGLPVIASVHDAGHEVNVDCETGFNVDLDRRSELGDRLIMLLREPDRARAMGQRGFERWQTHFRYSCFAQRFLGIWREFVADRQ